MKLFYGLIWTLFHVCWMLEHSKLVTSPRGGSVTIHCKYRRGNEEAVKYWCKEERFRLCSDNRTIRTTGSEKEVKQNGMAIKDNHALREFSVVMENLSHNDAGAYLCGVERKYDIWQPVELIVIADDVSMPTSRKEEYKTVEPNESPESSCLFLTLEQTKNLTCGFCTKKIHECNDNDGCGEALPNYLTKDHERRGKTLVNLYHSMVNRQHKSEKIHS